MNLEKKKSFGIGRRKQATAQVQLEVGGGTFLVNGRAVDEYFQYNKNYLKQVKLPLVDSDLVTNFNVNVKVKGGGLTGQSSAISLSIARALIDYNSSNRPLLKEKGLLTVDSRIKERKKYGLKKARKASQFSKR